MEFRPTERQRLALIITMVVGVGLLLVEWLIYRSFLLEEHKRLSNSQVNAVQVRAHWVGHFLANARKDVLLVKRLPAIVPALQGNDFAKQRLQQFFRSFLHAKVTYNQARILDASGRELVRAEYRDGVYTEVQDDLLQDKSHRYYFSEVRQLSSGDVYYSRLDLNVEHGVVERPYRPMLRLATPVFDEAGEFLGAVVLNYCGWHLLKQFSEHWPESAGELVLLDEQGYWLSGGAADDRWGFMFEDKQQRRLATRYPDVWEAMAKSLVGRYQSQDGTLFTWEAAELNQEKNNSLIIAAQRKSVAENQSAKDLANSLLFLYLGLMIPLGLGSWFYAGQREQRRYAETETQRALQLNQSILDSINEIFLAVDKDWQVIYYNPLVAEVMQAEELEKGVDLWDALPEMASFFYRPFAKAMRQREATTFEGYYPPLNKWFLCRLYPMEEGLALYFMDVTEKRASQERLQLADTAFCHTLDAIVIANRSRVITVANPATLRLTHFKEKDLIGHRLKQLLPRVCDRSDPDNEVWKRISSSGYWEGDADVTRSDGSSFPAWLKINTVHDVDGALSSYVCVFSDISEIRESQEQLTYLAHHDPLTELPNRQLLNDRLSHAIERAKRNHHEVAVLFIDLDHFKEINDTLGHPAGDSLLKQMALRCTNLVRESDTIARLGGDEFVIVLEDVSERVDVEKLANKLIEAMAMPLQIDGNLFSISASVGISFYPADGEDVTTLLKTADTAMYDAKSAGRNQYRLYDASLTDLAIENLTVKQALEVALREDQFVLHYQPQISLESGKVIGVEALIRWQKPDAELVYPGAFIGVAENTGLIEAIGNWVLQRCVKQIAQWQAQGVPPMRVAMNLSSSQLLGDGLSELLEEVLSEVDLDGWEIELEITETAIMQQPERAAQILESLKALGVSLAIDDFGTGYSSLSYLKRFPFDRLKIDRSFVRDVPDDVNDQALVRAIVHMGLSLGLTVIAEGVENDQQDAFLRRQHCDEAQGFLYHRPMTSDALVSLLRRSKNTAPKGS